jgi:hypothetical protein
MKYRFVLYFALFLSGCSEILPDLSGFSLSRKLEIDETLLTRPKAYQKTEVTVISESFILLEYADLSKSYTQCSATLNGLIDLLEKSNLVLKVPKQDTFMPNPSTEIK